MTQTTVASVEVDRVPTSRRPWIARWALYWLAFSAIATAVMASVMLLLQQRIRG